MASKIGDEDKSYKLKAGLFLGSVAGMSALFGFSKTISTLKKTDPQHFGQGVAGSTAAHAEPGAMLALRALGWGTIYAIGGTSFLCFVIWKLSGASNLKQFREKMGSILPTVPKNNPPRSRTEFSGMNDLLTYISTEKFGDKPVDNNTVAKVSLSENTS